MIVKLQESHRQTMRIGIVFAVVGIPFFHQVGGPGLERQIIFEASPCIAERRDWNPIRRKWGYGWTPAPGPRLPPSPPGTPATQDAKQVGFVICHSGCRVLGIGFTTRGSGTIGRWICGPLRNAPRGGGG